MHNYMQVTLNPNQSVCVCVYTHIFILYKLK